MPQLLTILVTARPTAPRRARARATLTEDRSTARPSYSRQLRRAGRARHVPRALRTSASAWGRSSRDSRTGTSACVATHWRLFRSSQPPRARRRAPATIRQCAEAAGRSTSWAARLLVVVGSHARNHAHRHRRSNTIRDGLCVPDREDADRGGPRRNDCERPRGAHARFPLRPCGALATSCSG